MLYIVIPHAKYIRKCLQISKTLKISPPGLCESKTRKEKQYWVLKYSQDKDMIFQNNILEKIEMCVI